MGRIQGRRLHVRGKDQEHKTHLSRSVSGSAYRLPLKTFPAPPLMWLSSPISFTIQKRMNERDYVRHNRNATHLFEPSKLCLALLETRWRFHTQNNQSLHSEIAVTPHKEYRRDLNSSTTRLSFSCSHWKKQADTTRIYGYQGYKMVVPLNSISLSILQHWLFC